jgi:hypothetical protein
MSEPTQTAIRENFNDGRIRLDLKSKPEKVSTGLIVLNIY